MKKSLLVAAIIVLVGLAFHVGGGAVLTRAEGPKPQGPAPQAALGTAFTYQGQLKETGNPVDGNADFRFSLWDAESAGSQVGSIQTRNAVAVSAGLFTVSLDFGSVFDGNARWLEVEVRYPSGSGSYTMLSPRQPLTAVPYALNSANAVTATTATYATNAGALDGQQASDFAPTSHTHAGNDITGTVASATSAGGFTGSLNGDVTGTQGATTVGKLQGVAVAGAAPSDGQILQFNGAQWAPANPVTYTNGSGLTLTGNQFSVTFAGTGSATTAARSDHNHDSSYWKLGGNSGTGPATSYLGTSDNQPLVVKTNGAEALRVGTNGNLGLGTISPTQKLTVKGNGLILGDDNPVARGVITTNLDAPYSVFVSGRYAYVASRYNDSLAIFDVSDPGNIVAKGSTTTNLDNATSVYVSGRYAYVTSMGNHRLAIFDISDSGNIVAKGYTTDHLFSPFSVFVSSKYAYVVSSGNNRLVIFDISDPTNIVYKGSTTNLPSPQALFVSGKYAYVVYPSNSALVIFDVSDPGNIVTKGSTTYLNNPQSVHVSGKYAYVTSAGNNWLAIFDVSNPNNIVTKGTISTNLSYPQSVFVSGKYAYVASAMNDRLAVFDVSNPTNIVAKGYTSANLSGPNSVYLLGKYAYVTSYVADSLAVFEVNNLDTPTLLSGNAQTSYLDVMDNASVGNNLNVQGGLNVGPGGALVDGDLTTNRKFIASTNAGPTTTVGVGERYRDNGIIAWGKVDADGTLAAEFGVSSVTKGTGTYNITLNASATDTASLIATASPLLTGPPSSRESWRLLTINQTFTNQFSVYIIDGNGVAKDNAFTFVVTGR